MEFNSFWQETFDLVMFIIYLVFALGAAFAIIYYFGVAVLGFDVGMAETFTMVGLTVAIFLALVFINFIKFKHWWERL